MQNGIVKNKCLRTFFNLASFLLVYSIIIVGLSGCLPLGYDFDEQFKNVAKNEKIDIAIMGGFLGKIHSDAFHEKEYAFNFGPRIKNKLDEIGKELQETSYFSVKTTSQVSEFVNTKGMTISQFEQQRINLLSKIDEGLNVDYILYAIGTAMETGYFDKICLNFYNPKTQTDNITCDDSYYLFVVGGHLHNDFNRSLWTAKNKSFAKMESQFTDLLKK